MDEAIQLVGGLLWGDARQPIEEYFFSSLNEPLESIFKLPSLMKQLNPESETKHVENEFWRLRDSLWMSCEAETRAMFERQVISNLTRPSVCTAEDLMVAARAHLLFNPDFDEIQYDAFGETVVSGILRRRSEPFEVQRGRFKPVLLSTADDSSREQVTLWSDSLGRRVLLSGSITLGDGQEVVYARIEGPFTRSALEVVQEEIGGVVRSMLFGVSLLHGQSGGGSAAGKPEPPVSLTRQLGNGLDLAERFLDIKDYVASYLANPTRKDSIDRRIRNAIHLLVEADRQQHKSIALALSVTAIEALVGRKGPELASLVADNVAALLEDEPSRRDDATQFVKKLYGKRSSVLHGSQLEHEYEDFVDARILAAGILRAMVERRRLYSAGEFEAETVDALLTDLRKSKFKPGEPIGVLPSPARRLWSERT